MVIDKAKILLRCSQQIKSSLLEIKNMLIISKVDKTFKINPDVLEKTDVLNWSIR